MSSEIIELLAKQVCDSFVLQVQSTTRRHSTCRGRHDALRNADSKCLPAANILHVNISAPMTATQAMTDIICINIKKH